MNPTNLQLLKTFLMILAITQFTPSVGQDFDYHRDFKILLEKSKDQTSDVYYPKLLKRFDACDSTLTNQDIITLMIGFTADKNYKPYNLVKTERAILRMISEENYQTAAIECYKVLKTNALNFAALVGRGLASMKLNERDAAIRKEKTMKIIRCIMWSGDGSIDRPYFVLSPIDGQILIPYILGGSIGTMGSGSDKNGYFLDMLEMEKDGVSVMQHFHISHATAKMFEK